MAAILRREVDGARRRVHIVGCERSGTTLLLEMTWAGFVFDGRCAREQSLFEDPPSDARIFLSKKPLDITRLDRVFRHDERLYVLYTVRDPRSVVTSRHAGRPDRYLSDFPQWLACERAAARLEASERFLRVSYERLVEEPDSVQAEIAARFPFLEKRGRFSEFHETAKPTRTGVLALGGVRPPDPSRLESWRGDLPRVKAQLRAHPALGATLIEAGFEPDDGWQKELEDVVPQKEPADAALRRALRNLDRRVRYGWKSYRYLRRRLRGR